MIYKQPQKKQTVEELLSQFDPKRRRVCNNILKDFSAEIRVFPGSVKKHQAWEGGYMDHVSEAMNIAVPLYETMNSRRKLPFTLNDALFVIFIHDLDKLLRYKTKKGRNDAGKNHDYYLEQVIELLNKKYSYKLTADEENGLRYVHGEIKDYHPTKRRMKPLACFVHCCDIISARMWHNYGKDKVNW